MQEFSLRTRIKYLGCVAVIVFREEVESGVIETRKALGTLAGSVADILPPVE